VPLRAAIDEAGHLVMIDELKFAAWIDRRKRRSRVGPSTLPLDPVYSLCSLRHIKLAFADDVII
jgi:hypothetical protein